MCISFLNKYFIFCSVSWTSCSQCFRGLYLLTPFTSPNLVWSPSGILWPLSSPSPPPLLGLPAKTALTRGLGKICWASLSSSPLYAPFAYPTSSFQRFCSLYLWFTMFFLSSLPRSSRPTTIPSWLPLPLAAVPTKSCPCLFSSPASMLLSALRACLWSALVNWVF